MDPPTSIQSIHARERLERDLSENACGSALTFTSHYYYHYYLPGLEMTLILCEYDRNHYKMDHNNNNTMGKLLCLIIHNFA